MNNMNKLVKGSIIVLIGMLLSKIFNFLFRIIVARTGSEEYGLFSIGWSFHGVLLVISVLGLDYGVVRYVGYYLGKNRNNSIRAIIKKSIKNVLIASFIFGLTAYVCSDFIAIHFFSNPNLTSIFKMFSLVLPVSALGSIAMAVIRGYKQVKYLVVIGDLLSNSIKVLFTIVFLYMGMSTTGVVLAFILSYLFSVPVYYYIINNRLISLFIKTKYLSKHNILSYSLPLIFLPMLVSLIIWSDTLMIGIFDSSRSAGIYNAAVPIVLFLNIIPSALMFLFVPLINEMHAKKNTSDLKYICQTTTKYIFIVNTILLIVLFIFSKSIILMLFGEEYIGSRVYLYLLMIGFFVYSLSQTSAHLLNMLSKTKLMSLNIALVIVINLILNYYFFILFETIGIAIATLLSFTIFSVLVVSQSYIFSRIGTFRFNFVKLVDSEDIGLLKDLVRRKQK